MPVIAASDIGLSCSETEGLSNSLMEYMAAGLPVVCTRAGGNEELVVDGTTGFVVPVGRPGDLAEALGRLADDAELRLRFGQEGKERIFQQFSPQTMVTAYENVYSSIGGSMSGTTRPAAAI